MGGGIPLGGEGGGVGVRGPGYIYIVTYIYTHKRVSLKIGRTPRIKKIHGKVMILICRQEIWLF